MAGALLLLTLLVLVAYPLVLLIYGSFLSDLPGQSRDLSLNGWTSALLQPGMSTALINTLKRTAITEIIALPSAIVIAWLAARTDMPGRLWLDRLLWMAFFLPALPVLLGWILLFDPDFGLANQLVMKVFGSTEPWFNIYSFWGIVFAHMASRSIAAKYIFLVPAFRNFDGALEEASIIAGYGTLRTLWQIVVPLLVPAIMVTAIISLVHSLESFEIELILGGPIDFYVFSTRIYRLIEQSPPLFGAATVLALAVLFCMLPLMIWQQRILASRNFATVTSHFRPRLLRLGRWRWPICCALALGGLIITLVPTLCLIMGTFMNLFGKFDLEIVWTLDHWSAILNDHETLSGLFNTLIMGLAAAGLALVWFPAIAYVTDRTRLPGHSLLGLLAWLPATLPGIILGLGLLWMFLTTPLLRGLYGSIGVLILAVLIAALSTGVQLIRSNLVQISRELEEASYITGASWLTTFRLIMMPLLGPVLLTVALLTFNSAARNVAGVAMLATASNRPLAMLQVDYMVDGRYEPAAIVGVLIVAMTLGMAFVTRILANRIGIRTH
jgi:iron(III) transport system permease protein